MTTYLEHVSERTTRDSTFLIERTKRYDNLPVWAQHELNRLASELAATEARLMVGPADSDTVADPYARVPRLLGRGPVIRHTRAEGDDITVEFTDDGVELMFSGGSAFVAMGGPCNVVRAQVRKDAP